MNKVLVLDNVGKSYPVYQSGAHRALRWFGFFVPPKSEFWANRGISFDLNAGESLAIVGQNGAGKSTLLKLIAGTIRPTEGQITVPGRVSAILELGIGFNPDFTGRENVYHSGGLLGHSREVIDRFAPDIEDFSELGEFFDKPTRVYSSGMMARLAFSLATAVRPEILIVDEVLSVGDSYFQHKSFDRIRRFRNQGTSIILVSHSMGTVRELADRVVLMEGGRVLRDGKPDEVVDFYNAMMADKSASENRKNMTIEQKRSADGWLVSRSGSFEAVVTSISLIDQESDAEVECARVGQPLRLRVNVNAKTDIPRLVLGLMLRDKLGHLIWGTNTWHTKQVVNDIVAGQSVTFELSFVCNLGPGSYSFSPALVSSSTHLENNYEWTDNMFVFDVIPNPDLQFFLGSSYLQVEFFVEKGEV